MLYLIAFLEGFTTLAVEIVAIRLATPIVGSSIVLTSVFLWIILLALSAGYYVWGLIASKFDAKQLRHLLIVYMTGSGLFYGIVTFSYEQWLLQFFLEITNNYILTLFLVALLLFFLPVFVASQTIPLLTELIPEQSKGKAAWSMLFASTLGSFLWSVGTSIILFDRIGVRKTSVIISCLLLVCAAFLLYKEHRKKAMLYFIGIVIYGGVLWSISNTFLNKISGLLYRHDSAYQEILIREQPRKNGKTVKIFHTNRAFASGIFKETKESPFDYMQEVMRLTDQRKPSRVLVIWTAGFTYPYQLSKLDYVERIDAVDIDPSIKQIAEQHFLEEPLSKKIVFIPQSARYVINQAVKNNTTYDLILLDAYNGKTLPDELTTEEFFDGLARIAPKEWIIANFILDSNLDSTLTRNVLTTRRSVFDDVWVKNVSNNPQKTFDNFVVTTYRADDFYTDFTKSWHLYTDDLRTTETDLVSMWRGRK